MGKKVKTETQRADRALDATGKNLRQAQQRLATLLAASRLAAAVRERRLGAAAASSTH
jgi:hypothetical protein